MNQHLYCLVICLCGLIHSLHGVCNNSSAELQIPDTTLNAKITLWNHTDISKTHLNNIVGDTNFVYDKSMVYEDSIQDNNASRIFKGELYPYVLLYNVDKTEFAIASPRYGTCHQCWRCFYIGLLSKETIEKEEHRVIDTDIPHFFTESGICLNMPIDEVIALKGNPNIDQDTLMTYYYISSDLPVESEEYRYYTENNIGNMFITLIILNNRVVGIGYGYMEI